MPKTKVWKKRKEIKGLITNVSSSETRKLTNKERLRQFWEEYAKAIRPDLEAEDRLQAESMARSFTKVVRI